jgi:hypothetical protein
MPPGGEPPHRLGPRPGRAHRVAGPLEIASDQVAQFPVVLHYQHRAGHITTLLHRGGVPQGPTTPSAPSIGRRSTKRTASHWRWAGRPRYGDDKDTPGGIT